MSFPDDLAALISPPFLSSRFVSSGTGGRMLEASPSLARVVEIAIVLAVLPALSACEEKNRSHGEPPPAARTPPARMPAKERGTADGTAGSGSGRSETPVSERGANLFQIYCAACHAPGDLGIESGVPPLDGSPWVAGPESRLVRIVLHGLHGPIEIRGKTYDLSMPSFGPILDDEEIAAILTYARRRFAEGSAPVEPETVRRIREATRERADYWTVDDLLEIDGEGNSKPPGERPSP